jgi:protein gp37
MKDIKYVVQFIFPSLGKVDKCMVLNRLDDVIKVPLIERYISATPMETPLDGNISIAPIKYMEFIFNGNRTPQNFEYDFRTNGYQPTSFICEYEFNGVKEC